MLCIYKSGRALECVMLRTLGKKNRTNLILEVLTFLIMRNPFTSILLSNQVYFIPRMLHNAHHNRLVRVVSKVYGKCSLFLLYLKRPLILQFVNAS